MRAATGVVILLVFAIAPSIPAQEFDLVISGGRVMDPESGLDAVRDVGVSAGRIAAISTQRLRGKMTLTAAGRVVAPGFIDLHAHGQTNDANRYQAHDGVTTALELEVGAPFTGEFLRERSKGSILNFGATVSHGAARVVVMKEHAADVRAIRSATGESAAVRWNAISQRGRYRALDQPEEITQLAAEMERQLREGALGIGMAHQYYPGASREEIFRVFQMAARWKVPIFCHVRAMGIDAIQEVIANAAATGASLHIVHLNSVSLGSIPVTLDMVESARSRGLDITTEAYPYTAGSTFIESTIFDEGWQQRLAISYGDLQWQNTGERLTKESFERYRKQGGIVISHMMKPEWIERAMSSPFVMVASDGMPYAPGAHPRSAGTFARALGYYSRERKAMPLMEALRKMTLMPARRLEAIAPAMKNKGRVKVGADADITVFDPATVRDTATFEKGLSFSTGIDHVVVNGVPVVREGKTVEGAMPGRAVAGVYGK
jgi:N-acyl-D-aspartate/D-glutamate deacylase